MKKIKTNKIISRISLFAVLCLSLLVVFVPGVRAAYNDDAYGQCAYGVSCPTPDPPDDPDDPEDPDPPEDNPQPEQPAGPTVRSDGGSPSDNSPNIVSRGQVGWADRITTPLRNVLGALEDSTSKLTLSNQKALPFYVWGLLIILAIILLAQGLLDRKKIVILKSTSKRLQTLLEDQKNFIHLVVHNLNTPLTVAKTSVELLGATPEKESAALALLKPATFQLASTIEDALVTVGNEDPVQNGGHPTAASSISLRSSLSTKYFIIPVVAAVSLGILANIIQLRIGTELPQFYIFYQIIIGVISVVILANAIRLFKLSQNQHIALMHYQSASEDLSKRRTHLMIKLGSGLSDNLHKLKAGIRLIKNKKVELMMSSGQMSLENIAAKIDIATNDQVSIQEQVLLSTTINDILHRMSAEISQKSLSLHTDFTNEKPIKTYGKELNVTLESVIDNAIRYNHHSGDIKISYKLVNGILSVKVKDTGKGISAQQQENMFKPFAKADDVLTGDQETVGLSLYACKTALDRIGGKIIIQSEAGKGTTVTVSMPASDV